MPNTTIKTTLGELQGVSHNGAIAYLGIPFAKPPVGDLRFRAPQPVEPWEGVLAADKFKANPIQHSLALPLEAFSEDCLYLNVWVPDCCIGKGDKLPVLLWIPGGAFQSGGSGHIGSDHISTYEFSKMAHDTGCIIVGISYRLNAFGFLNMAKYSDRFDDNLGMLDALAALRWVNREISAFGGDSKNVVLMGQSAGAGIVAALMLCEEARPYFSKAIIQSCCFGSYYTEDQEDTLVKEYLNILGLTTCDVDRLLDMDAKTLLDATIKLELAVSADNAGRCTFCPVVDGTFIKQMPTLDGFEDWSIPVLIGSTKNEGNLFTTLQLFQTTTEDWVKNVGELLRNLTPTKKEQVLRAYPNPMSADDAADLTTDAMYAIPKLRFAEHLSRRSKAYVYRYDYATPCMSAWGLKASHIAELLPLFSMATEPYRSWGKGDEENLEKIGRRMRRYWGEFARTGVPAENWIPYDAVTRCTMVIDKEDRLMEDPDEAKRKAYEGIDRILV